MNFTASNSTSSNKDSFAVIGNGSWATALVKIFTDSGIHVNWYFRKKEKATYIEKYLHNQDYLTQVKFNPEKITPNSDINELIQKSKWLVLATPSLYLEALLEQVKTPLSDKIVISGVKGILPKSNLLPGAYLNTNLGLPRAHFVVLSGPSHAEEIALNRLSFLTIGCSDLNIASFLKQKMKAPYLKLKTSDDILGIEYSATLKNIFALAAGIAKGLNYGDNFQSVLISNSVMEMKRLLKKISPSKRNINHSVYLGDLLVTAYSIHSRNRRFGELIGKGLRQEQVQKQMKMVAEGYFASKTIYDLKRDLDVKTPIIDAVYAILYQQESPEKSFKNLVQELT